MTTVRTDSASKEKLVCGALTPRDKELYGMPTVASQFPVSFASGVQWTTFVGKCKCCDKELPDDALHGTVTWLLPNVAALEAVGVCMECKLLTRFLHRFYDDGRITGPRGGKWRTWTAEKPSFFARLRALFNL